MKYTISALLVLMFWTATANAQDAFQDALPGGEDPPAAANWDAADPRYETPKQAVRRKAAWKAAQRRYRLEAMKRLGYSPSRPPASPLPFMGAAPRTWIVVPKFSPLTVTFNPYGISTVPVVGY